VTTETAMTAADVEAALSEALNIELTEE